MRLLAALLALAACTPSTTTTPADITRATAIATDAREALRTVERTFDAMRTRDTATLRALFHEEARIVITEYRDGQPRAAVIPIDRFIASVGRATETLDERIWDPEVRVDDNLATVWTPYDFHVGDRFSHCGVDAIQLVRTNTGWRIIHVTDTHRQENCGRPPAD